MLLHWGTRSLACCIATAAAAALRHPCHVSRKVEERYASHASQKSRGKLKPATATAATAAAVAVATAVVVATAIAVSAATLFLRAAAAGGCRIEWVAAAGAWRKS